MSEKTPPDDFWPWSWLTHSRPSASFREKSEEWEEGRLRRGGPGAFRWFLCGGALGLLVALAQAC